MEEIIITEFLIDEIIHFIKSDLDKESKLNSRLLIQFKKVLDSVTRFKENNKKLSEPYFNMKLETFLNFFNELKEIRNNYQKGLIFAKNQTKGEKKGFNFRWHQFLKMKMERNEIEEAQKDAIMHLDRIKKWYSERTYYRHKKRIKELGIKIS